MSEVTIISQPEGKAKRKPAQRIERASIVTSRLVSIVFTPFYLPLVSTVLLFMFSYLSILPWQYKTFIFVMVYLFTRVSSSVFQFLVSKTM